MVLSFGSITATLNVRFCTDSLVHVTYRQGNGTEHPQPWIAKSEWPSVAFRVEEDPSHNIVIRDQVCGSSPNTTPVRLVFEDAPGNRFGSRIGVTVATRYSRP